MGRRSGQLPALYTELINERITDRPANMSICTHLCRGNSRSSWGAKVLLNALKVTVIFGIRYATGGKLRAATLLAQRQKMILGVTTKSGELEKADDLKRRIDEASKLVPLDQLGISPQCGFSSTVLGNKLTIDDQIAKLRLVVQVAKDVWG